MIKLGAGVGEAFGVFAPVLKVSREPVPLRLSAEALRLELTATRVKRAPTTAKTNHWRRERRIGQVLTVWRGRATRFISRDMTFPFSS
jgi:hypothetical protein